MSLDRRTSFGEDAELYDRIRPGYPDPLFDDLAAITGLREEARVLEVGCGTGQATLPLARRGFRVLAVELSATLAEVARRNHRAFPRVEVVVGAFEEMPAPPEPFELVLAATALHWADPSIRFRKVAEILRSEGWVAVLHTHHVAGGTTAFFEESQQYYRRFFPESSVGFRLPRAEDVPRVGADLAGSGMFGPAIARSYPWEQRYATADYLDLLRTYSDHRSLGPDRREELLTRLGTMIDERFSGEVRKAYLTVLSVARKVDPAIGAGASHPRG
ncbi:MAG: class I SAM-dependent methyltransferase [Thermoplasmata archaeon]